MSIDEQLSKIDRDIELKEQLRESSAALSEVQSELWNLRRRACVIFDEELTDYINRTCLDKGFQLSKEDEAQIYTYKDHLEIKVSKQNSLFLEKKVGGKREKNIQLLHSSNAENYTAKSNASSIEEKMEQHNEAKLHYEALLEKRDTWVIKAQFNHLDGTTNTTEVYSPEEVLEYLLA